jgi:hypothetical protein
VAGGLSSFLDLLFTVSISFGKFPTTLAGGFQDPLGSCKGIRSPMLCALGHKFPPFPVYMLAPLMTHLGTHSWCVVPFSFIRPCLCLTRCQRTKFNWVCWCVPVIPVIKRQRKEDGEFKVSLGYRVGLCLKTPHLVGFYLRIVIHKLVSITSKDSERVLCWA